MIETCMLAAGVPAAIAATRLASRRKLSLVPADNRGIALQTVIIIVVLIVIAGAVAGVLLSRSGDVIADLEAQDITAGTIDTEAECENHEMGTGNEGVWRNTQTDCTWTAQNDGANPPDVTPGRCSLAGGNYTAGTSSSPAKCIIDVPA